LHLNTGCAQTDRIKESLYIPRSLRSLGGYNNDLQPLPGEVKFNVSIWT